MSQMSSLFLRRGSCPFCGCLDKDYINSLAEFGIENESRQLKEGREMSKDEMNRADCAAR